MAGITKLLRGAASAAKKKKKTPAPAVGGKGGGRKDPPKEKGPKAQVQGEVEKKLDRRAAEKAERKEATGREKKLLDLKAAMQQNKNEGFFKQPKEEAGQRAERMMRGRRVQAQGKMQGAYEANMKKYLDPSNPLYKDGELGMELNRMRQRAAIDRGFDAALKKEMKDKADKMDAAEKRILDIAANPGKNKSDMNKGGVVKSRTGAHDYRMNKGGLLLSSVDNRKKR